MMHMRECIHKTFVLVCAYVLFGEGQEKVGCVMETNEFYVFVNRIYSQTLSFRALVFACVGDGALVGHRVT